MASKHRWTMADLAVLCSNSTPKSADIIGVSAKAVKNARILYGIPSTAKIGNQKKVFAEDVAQMMMLRESGFTNRQVSVLKCMSMHTVIDCIHRAKKLGFDAFPKRSEACRV